MNSATLHLHSQMRIGTVDPRVFGGFLEHMGRAVYEGVYDPKSAHADSDGFRTDVLAALKELNMTAMRYPGGNFASGYHWLDGVGPKEKRPVIRELAWQSVETNHFGTDEYIRLCRKLGWTPMITVNMGTGTPEEARNWVEYCNSPVGTRYADMRAANGSPEPYGVKLWCLGNEMDGIWQAGHVPADEYARRAQQAAIMMKGLDRNIQTIAAGSSGRFMHSYMSWDRTVLEYCWDQIDFISAHRYSNNDRQDSAWFLAEGVEIDRVIEDYKGLLGYVRGLKRSNKQVYLSFDEWNVWYKDRNGDGNWAAAPHLLEEVYNLEDALVCAQYLSSFIRHADTVKLACIAQIVNVIAPVLTRKEGSLIQSIYYPFLLYSKHAGGVSLSPTIITGTYKAGERGDVPAVDVSASYDAATHQLSVFLVNRDQGEPAAVDVHLSDANIDGVIGTDIMGGVDVKAANTWDQPNLVKPFSGKATVINGGVHVKIPAPGMAVVRCHLVQR